MREDPTHLKPELFKPGLASQFGPPGLMARPHCHDDVELNFLEEGSITYLFGEKPVTVEAGQLALFWATMPHQLVESDPATQMYWLHLPLASFLQWQLPNPLNEQILNGKMVLDRENESFRHDRILFKQWDTDLKDHSAVQSGIALLEIEARLRRLALKWAALPQQAVSPKKPGIAPSKVEQMASYIVEHYTRPLKIEQIARHVGLHTNYAMTVFRQAYGMTMNQYLIRYRVLHAQRLLATTDRKILDIALEAGFESLSGFYTAFENICEVTPRQYRISLY
jgi:AraC family transcriptional regulator, melibiose operon regulatory protein